MISTGDAGNSSMSLLNDPCAPVGLGRGVEYPGLVVSCTLDGLAVILVYLILLALMM